MIITRLFRRQDGNEVVVDLLRFLANALRVLLFAKIFASEPKQQIFFAELGPQKLTEQSATSYTSNK